jgi:hypothetical protein
MEPKIELPSVTFEWENKEDQIGTNTITLSANDYNTTVIGGGFSLSNSSISGSNTYPYTVSATGGPFTIRDGINNQLSSSKIRLDGDGADIEVNGWSLVDSIKQIEERLNILQPNTKLESEWAELRELGEQYRKLEQHIKDKQATWDRVKAMPPPAIN